MQEPISFCPDPYVRYTKWAARYVLGLRKAMSISDVARFTGLHWETVKNIEKAWLEKRSRKIRLGEVEYLGIDEVHLGRVLGFITVVRDLDSGAVLFVGKGGEALEPFGKRLKRRAKPIKAVAIDMANSYRAWVAEVLPDADIVYDHFHVIKLMNERMNTLRRSTMNKLQDEQKKELKGKRFLLLRNEENLSEEALADLKRPRSPESSASSKWPRPSASGSKDCWGIGNTANSPTPAKRDSTTRLAGSPDKPTAIATKTICT